VQTVKRLLGGVGVVSLGTGVAFDVGVTPFADPLLWAAAWCWLVAVGLGDRGRRREALAAACLVVAAVGFSLAWIGAATWRTTTFPAAGCSVVSAAGWRSNCWGRSEVRGRAARHRRSRATKWSRSGHRRRHTQ
jgi:hypothetical protein